MGKMSLLSRSFVCAVAVSSLTSFGCGDSGLQDGDPGVSQAALADDFDGEALFRGLILMDGEAGEMIPEIREHFSLRSIEMSDEARAEIAETQHRIVATIREVDPGFFDRFVKWIRTGDHELVAAAMEDGSKTLLVAAREMVGADRYKLFFEEVPVTLIANEYLPEEYQGRFDRDLLERIKNDFLTVNGRLGPSVPYDFSALRRGFALDAAVDVNWFIDRAVNIHFMIDHVRAFNIARIIRDYDRLDRFDRHFAPVHYALPFDRLDRLRIDRYNLNYDRPVFHLDEFQVVIREKMIDSITQTFRRY